MRRRALLGGFSDEHLLEGTPDPEQAAFLEELRRARVEAARRHAPWTEIPDDLVPRGRGMFVSAGTDQVYTPARGVVFLTGSVTIVADQAPYFFVVSEDGGLTFYERLPGTWSELVEGRERRRLARR